MSEKICKVIFLNTQVVTISVQNVIFYMDVRENNTRFRSSFSISFCLIYIMYLFSCLRENCLLVEISVALMQKKCLQLFCNPFSFINLYVHKRFQNIIIVYIHILSFHIAAEIGKIMQKIRSLGVIAQLQHQMHTKKVDFSL